MNKLTEALNALRLEVDGSIVDHLQHTATEHIQIIIEENETKRLIQDTEIVVLKNRIRNAEKILWDLIDWAKEYLPTEPKVDDK